MSRPRSSGYHRCWQAAQELERFNRSSLAEKAGCSLSMAAFWMREWIDEGRIAVDGLDGRKVMHKVLVTEPDGDAERRARVVPRRVESPRGNMWTAMRQMTTFGPLDLAAAASTETTTITREIAAEYCRTLLRIKYLKVVRKAVPGVRDPLYRLTRNTGPRPPIDRRVSLVWDPNTENWLGHPEGGQ